MDTEQGDPTARTVQLQSEKKRLNDDTKCCCASFDTIKFPPSYTESKLRQCCDQMNGKSNPLVREDRTTVGHQTTLTRGYDGVVLPATIVRVSLRRPGKLSTACGVQKWRVSLAQLRSHKGRKVDVLVRRLVSWSKHGVNLQSWTRVDQREVLSRISEKRQLLDLVMTCPCWHACIASSTHVKKNRSNRVCRNQELASAEWSL